MKKNLLYYYVVIALFAFSLVRTANAHPFDILTLFHFRPNINAVYFDGNTCTETPTLWNVPPQGNTFFVVLPVTFQPNAKSAHHILMFATGKRWVPFVEPNGGYVGDSDPNWDAGMVFEVEENQGYLSLSFWGYNGAYHSLVSADSVTRPITYPYDGKYQVLAIYIDTWNVYGTWTVVEQGGGRFEGGLLTVWDNWEPHDRDSGPPGAIMDWESVQHWYFGCNGNPTGTWVDTIIGNHAYWHQGNMAEAYVDLEHEYILPNALSLFANSDGTLRGLNDANHHDCTEPWGTGGFYIPNDCHTGNANFFPNGPFIGPAPSHVLNTIAGTLQTATDDNCEFRGIGDGCIVTGPPTIWSVP